MVPALTISAAAVVIARGFVRVMVTMAPMTASAVPVLTLGAIAVPVALARAPVLATASMPMLALSAPARGRAARPLFASVVGFLWSIHYSDVSLSSRKKKWQVR